ncbi:STAS domain-containing protein [Spirillospora sp. CA-253888]
MAVGLPTFDLQHPGPVFMDEFTSGSSPLRLSSRHEDGAFIITAIGDLDFATAAQLLNCMDSVFIQLARLPRRPSAGPARGGDPGGGPGEGRRNRRAARGWVNAVVIDAGGVAFIDARGLGTLITIADGAHRRRLSFVLAAPSAAVRRLLAITDMHHRFLALPAWPTGAPGLDPRLDLSGSG